MNEKTKYFIEVGSCDFDTLLPLCDNGWKGACVEPVKTLAENLRKEINARSLPVELIESAVSDLDGTAQMTQVDKFDYDGPDYWARGVSHISQAHTKGLCLLDNVNKIIPRVNVEVPTLTLNSLIKHLSNSSAHFKDFTGDIDFMRLDAEGHELNILEAYDWSIKPNWIKVEHKHSDRLAIEKILKGQGYYVMNEEEDMYGVL
ncbi:MAG TPA: hypothetical protein DEG69_15940 [Flavobacteriaceae bacterium]|nr:hypothetical protein [Flavobacteriaceae bacterium]